MKYATPADRLAAHSVFEPVTGCWIWVAARNNQGRPVIAHRIRGKARHMLVTQYVIRVVRGDRATRRTVGMHTCDNPLCVAPDHIVTGTQLRNMRDMVAKGRWRGWAKDTMHATKGASQ